MHEFAFISRHQPTTRQHELAAEQGITLHPVGDTDAFSIKTSDYVDYDGVVVVHPAAALRLAPKFRVGIFENANRAPIGQPPQFEAVALHVFDLRQPSQAALHAGWVP